MAKWVVESVVRPTSMLWKIPRPVYPSSTAFTATAAGVILKLRSCLSMIVGHAARLDLAQESRGSAGFQPVLLLGLTIENDGKVLRLGCLPRALKSRQELFRS